MAAKWNMLWKMYADTWNYTPIIIDLMFIHVSTLMAQGVEDGTSFFIIVTPFLFTFSTVRLRLCILHLGTENYPSQG